MDLDYYITASRQNINKSCMQYTSIKNITCLPKNLFSGFPPVYLITINRSDPMEMQSMVNIKLSNPVCLLTSEELHLLREYTILSEEYNHFLSVKHDKKMELNRAEAVYKYNKYIEETVDPDLYLNYRKTKQNYQQYKHFDKTKIILLDDLYQHFLSKI